jgi:hypothetical protein
MGGSVRVERGGSPDKDKSRRITIGSAGLGAPEPSPRGGAGGSVRETKGSGRGSTVGMTWR